jgi:hypothetical protein
MARRNNAKRRRRAQATEILDVIKRLREQKAPMWIIKSTQISLVLNRQGFRHVGIGKPASKKQNDLYDKYVCPLMG